MKMIVFDCSPSAKQYITNMDLKDFEIEYIDEPLNENTQLTEEQLNETGIICVYITSKLSESVIKKFRNLRIIASRSAHYDHIDIEYCSQNNIAVFKVPEYGIKSAVQYILMLIITLLRNVVQAYNSVKNSLSDNKISEGRELSGISLGLIGCDTVGKEVAKLANKLNIAVSVCDFKKDKELMPIVKYLSFDEILNSSDIISLHIPVNEQTYHLINQDSFSKMKDSSFIINISDGELIDLIALYNNILSGKIQGAALDIVSCESITMHSEPINNEDTSCFAGALITQKLLSCPNVIITPRIAYYTEEASSQALDSLFCSIRDYTKGLHTNQLRL